MLAIHGDEGNNKKSVSVTLAMKKNNEIMTTQFSISIV